MTEDEVRTKLKDVIDPELGINIVDLGLVYGVKVKNEESGFKIHILMTLTTPACPLAGSFELLIRESLKELSGVDDLTDIEVELTFDPPWTAEMMSRESRVELGFE